MPSYVTEQTQSAPNMLAPLFFLPLLSLNLISTGIFATKPLYRQVETKDFILLFELLSNFSYMT